MESNCGMPRFNEGEKTFGEALAGVQELPRNLKKDKDDRANAVEIKFYLTVTDELGNLATGMVSIVANYGLTLKWKNKPEVAKKV